MENFLTPVGDLALELVVLNTLVYGVLVGGTEFCDGRVDETKLNCSFLCFRRLRWRLVLKMASRSDFRDGGRRKLAGEGERWRLTLLPCCWCQY